MIDSGGPALPGGRPGVEYGMTLRDWFAGQALVGIGTWCPQEQSDLVGGSYFPDAATVAKRRAQWAYLQADAMLAARKQDSS